MSDINKDYERRCEEEIINIRPDSNPEPHLIFHPDGAVTVVGVKFTRDQVHRALQHMRDKLIEESK